MLGQEFGGAFAHEADPEPINHTFHRSLLASLDFVEHVLCRLLAHAFQLEKIVLGQSVDIGDILDHAAVGQLVDQCIAHTLDVHHSSRGKVQNTLPQLGGTVCVHAAMIGLAFGSNHVAAAYWAAFGHSE